MSSGTAHDRDWRHGVRRILLWVLAGVLVWLAVTQWLAPWLIRGAHEGRIPLLSGVIEGRDRFPVGRYLAIWDRAVLPLTLGFLAIAAVLLAAYGLRHRIRTAMDRVLRREPTVTWRGVLSFALVFGALTGLAEACIAIAPLILNGNPQVPGPEALWMAPLAAAVAALVMSLPLVALARRKGVSLRLVGGAFTLLFAYTVIVTLELGIHRYAAVVLGCGIAVTLASLMVRRPAITRRSLRALGFATPVLIVLGLASTTVGGRLLERSRLARLIGVPGKVPNVLLLILDTVRAASMSLNGYDRATTPAIAAFAGTGVTFDRAISPAPWTLPAHASIFTGRLSHEVGTDFRKRLDETHPTLAEILSERGYATAGFAANLAYTRTASGLARGFAVYRDGRIDLPSIAASSRWTRGTLESALPWFGVHRRLVRKTAEEVNEEFTGWLDQRLDRPFFAFLNYFDAHAPYETHAPFDRRFSEHSPRYWLIKGTQRADSPELLNEIIDSYDSALAYLDHHVGQLLEAAHSGATGRLAQTRPARAQPTPRYCRRCRCTGSRTRSIPHSAVP